MPTETNLQDIAKKLILPHYHQQHRLNNNFSKVRTCNPMTNPMKKLPLAFAAPTDPQDVFCDADCTIPT
ncbi:MAG TPA: hypothetical protein VMZ26_09305 [Pyrinomonadaceae bacterium]|nr:hypothetical protein [Pyrinomonadaceae bacterium]